MEYRPKHLRTGVSSGELGELDDIIADHDDMLAAPDGAIFFTDAVLRAVIIANQLPLVERRARLQAIQGRVLENLTYDPRIGIEVLGLFEPDIPKK